MNSHHFHAVIWIDHHEARVPMQSDGRRGDRMMNRRAAAAQKRRPNRSRPKACSRRGSLWVGSWPDSQGAWDV
jgi:hypothetical protein